METHPPIEPIVFQFHSNDLRYILQDLLRLEVSPTSPLAGYFKNLPPGQGTTTPQTELQVIANNPNLQLAGKVLAQSEWVLELNLGGGTRVHQQLLVCRSPSMGIDQVAVFSPPTQGMGLLQTFVSYAQFVHWLIGYLEATPLFIALEANSIANLTSQPHQLFPNELPLESFIYLLHSIDAFRRASYHNLLEQRTGEVGINAQEFEQSLALSRSSGDTRWLLPAFLALNPGLMQKAQPRPEHLYALLGHGLLAAGHFGNPPVAFYTFPERGNQLGVEFYRTWCGSAGMELSIPNTTRQRFFVCTTALCHHVFKFQPAGEGIAVTHQPLNNAGLSEVFNRLSNGPLAANAPAQASAPPVGPNELRCPQCHTVQRAGARFCKYCGTKLA